jgi:hypothetical protein
VDVRIRPAPRGGEARALEAAVRRLRTESRADPYGSRWRTAGLPAGGLLPAWVPGAERRSPGAKRA